MILGETRKLRDLLSIIIAACKDKQINEIDIKVDTSFGRILIELKIPQKDKMQ